MNKDEVTFCLKMALSEMTELAQTVTSSHDEALKLMIECLGSDPSTQPKNDNDVEIIASGGVAHLKDIIAVKKAGFAGVIIGKALYNNNFSLLEALSC